MLALTSGADIARKCRPSVSCRCGLLLLGLFDGGSHRRIAPGAEFRGPIGWQELIAYSTYAAPSVNDG